MIPKSGDRFSDKIMRIHNAAVLPRSRARRHPAAFGAVLHAHGLFRKPVPILDQVEDKLFGTMR
jgi:hypothetical protein